MNKAYLLTGGNIGHREQYLQQAIDLISKSCGRVASKSSLYETAAWGNINQLPFLNQALLLHSAMTPEQLMRALLNIEEQMGRRRTEKYGPRVIDIDVLLFNDLILQSPIIQIPHPELTNRRFALAPLAEIAPDLIHPAFQKTILDLLEDCQDDLAIHKLG